jgi:F-type H+-transporting ATPase subunit delta
MIEIEQVRHPTVFDTDQQHAGDVYAKALLGAAAKAGQTQEVVEELDALVSEVFETLPKLEAALTSPRVSLDAKFRLLDRAFGRALSELMLRFLKVVCRHRRSDCLRSINRAVHEQYHEFLGCVDVQVRTAQSLSMDQRAAISARLETMLAKRVNLIESVDPKLIGGLVVRVGDTVYDGSVANQLVQLRRDAVEKTIQTIKEALERFEVAE